MNCRDMFLNQVLLHFLTVFLELFNRQLDSLIGIIITILEGRVIDS